jgi:rSAM/selenodomain-associated transferase 2
VSIEVSVIIPVRNEAGIIEHCLKALQEQLKVALLDVTLLDMTLLDVASRVEIIVVDGFSDDDSVVIAGRFADQVLQAKGGRAGQMNAGARVAQGQLLVFLHIDTQLPQCYFDDLMLFASSGSAWGFSPVRLSGSHWMFRVIERMISWRSAMSHVATGDQVMVMRAEVFARLHGFASLALMEDVAMSLALKRQNLKPWVFPSAVKTSSRRWEQKGIWPTIFLMWRLRLLYRLGVSPTTLASLYR